MTGSTQALFQFKFAGFPVRIFSSNLLICGLLGFLWGAPLGLAAGLSVAIIFFLSIFLHECGHAFMCKALGVPVIEMQLNGMGGFVSHKTGIPFPTSFLITLAGPLATLALVILGAMLSGTLMVGRLNVMALMAQINLLLLIFNLLPIVPLDGGMLLNRLLWMFYSNSSGGQVVPIKKWKNTPDQISGKIGVVVGYLWFPAMALLFFTTGILFIFFPPLAYSKELAAGRARIPQ